jgi:hypothetical protein
VRRFGQTVLEPSLPFVLVVCVAVGPADKGERPRTGLLGIEIVNPTSTVSEEIQLDVIGVPIAVRVRNRRFTYCVYDLSGLDPGTSALARICCLARAEDYFDAEC